MWPHQGCPQLTLHCPGAGSAGWGLLCLLQPPEQGLPHCKICMDQGELLQGDTLSAGLGGDREPPGRQKLHTGPLGHGVLSAVTTKPLTQGTWKRLVPFPWLSFLAAFPKP